MFARPMTMQVDGAADDDVPAVRDDRPLEIALINSAPGPSFAKVTRRFGSLLQRAAGGRDIRLHVARFGSLPPVGDDAGRPVSVDDLFASRRLDAAVMTGAEPSCEDLADEPHWDELTSLYDWAASAGLPLVLSCLAAHAAVLHADGIERRRLPAKCFGVFEVQTVTVDPLLRGMPGRFVMPHSRWNGVDEGSLSRAGYRVLTRSAEIGVDLFVRRGRALNLYLQGHPEYGPTTLLGEYRRDLQRAPQMGGASLPAMTGHERWSETATRIFENWFAQFEVLCAPPVLADMRA